MSELPKQLTGFPSIYTHQVIWGEMDAFQHVNNTVYFRYFETSRIHFMHELGYLNMMKVNSCGPILASVECQFKVPVEYPDTLLIGARISDIKDSEFIMHHAVYSQAKQCVAATGQGRIVHYDYKLKKRAALPSELLDAITQFQNAKS